MKFWNRRNKIEFFHSEPSIVESFPIIEFKQLKLKWVEQVKQNFANLKKQLKGYTEERSTHISKCPGIFELFKYGYVVRLHKDVIIIRESNDKFTSQFINRFQFQTHNFTELFHVEAVDQSAADLITKPPWAANFMVKIDTGWNVIAPKGVKFLMLPIEYPDTFDFTATVGILNPAINSQINFQMYWNATDDKTILPAGTPLGHLIPLTEKNYPMVQRVMNQHDREWLEKLYSLMNTSFWPSTMRKKLKDVYNKHWKR